MISEGVNITPEGVLGDGAGSARISQKRYVAPQARTIGIHAGRVSLQVVADFILFSPD
jgi:hypothetical protein